MTTWMKNALSYATTNWMAMSIGAGAALLVRALLG